MAESTMVENVLKQVEYYFGDNNFPRDKFMKSECAKGEGWIKVETLLTFNRLKALLKELPEDQHVSKIAEILKASTLVDVDESGKKLRRNPDVPLDPNTEARTVYLKGFPKVETKLDDLFEFFKKYEGVEAVIMRWYKEKTFETAPVAASIKKEDTTDGAVLGKVEKPTETVAVKAETTEADTEKKVETAEVAPVKVEVAPVKVEAAPVKVETTGKVIWVKKFKGSILVVFKSVELATKFLAETDIVFMGSKIEIKMFHSEYKKLKREEYVARVELRKKKDAPSEAGDEANGKSEDKKDGVEAAPPKDDIVKGALVKLTNIPPTCSREEFKEKWYSATNEKDFKVIFVDFSKGASEGIIRLEKEGSAQSAMKILSDGKLKLGEDTTIDVAALDGDAEEKYLGDITAKRMMLKRSGGPTRGGGRGRGRPRGRGGKRRRY